MKSTVKRLVCVLMLIALIAGFVPAMSVSAVPAYDRLSVSNQTFYNYLKAQIADVASGKITSTEFTMRDPEGILRFTKEDLDVSEIISGGRISPEASNAFSAKFAECLDLDRIVRSLLADCPFELFWYDKIRGTSIVTNRRATGSEIMVTEITFKLAVSSDYSNGMYKTNRKKIEAAANVVNTAKSIVAKHASKSDMDKLIAYKDEICQLVSYDHQSEQNPFAPYGNPWQLINVFDGKKNTNVVCEGYSKAFKYLCDLTDFQGDVKCYLVNGYMQGGTGEGPHMWNVVEINGGTLMVDVTNCDEGTIGAPDKLFLQVGQKNGDYYVFDCGGSNIYYAYSQADKDLYTDGYLELKPAAPTKLETPTVTVSNAAKGVEISWNAIAGATSYTVYRSVYSGGKWSGWTAIKSGVTGTSHTDTTVKSGSNVKYTVKAIGASANSNVKASNAVKYLAMPAVKVANAANGVKLTWGAIGGATSYKIYRSVYSNGAWSSWTAIKSGVAGTTYTDTSVKSNANVKYTVRAVNGNYSSAYTSSSAIKFLATPTVKAANAAKGVTVTWNKISGAKSYTVYRSVYSNGKWSGWTAIKIGVTGTSFTDTAVKSGTTVRYTVKAINGNYSSNVKASNTTKFLAQPAVKVAKVTNGIKVTWGKIAGASGYYVYRRTYVNGKWGAWEKVKTTTAVSFTDTTAKKGVYYQYAVRAYSGSYTSTYTNSSSIKR